MSWKETFLPKKKGFEIIFYENGQKLQKETQMKDIKYPLTWGLEKSVLLPVFKKFYYFWKDFFKILRKKKQEQVQEPLQQSETEPISIFKNFSIFWRDIIKILKEREAEKTPKIRESDDSVEGE